MDYRSYYYFSNLKWTTVTKYLRQVKATYRYKHIPIYDLPKISTAHANKNKPMTIKQLLSKKELQRCIELSDITLSAIIVFGKDTGLSLSDILSLKLKDFIKDSYEFHNLKFTKMKELGKTTVNCEYYTDFVIKVCNKLQELLNEKYQITGTIYPRRKKTGKEHFCFYTYESLKFIVSMLLERTSKIKEYDHKYTRGIYDENYVKRQLYPDSQLFKMNVSVAAKKFHRINETLKLGNVGDSGRFSSHKLRKFNANMLRRGGFSIDEVNELQGRGKLGSNSSYFFADYISLKEKYQNATPYLQLYTTDYQLKTTQEKLEEEEAKNKKLIYQQTLQENKIRELEKNQEQINKNIQKETQKAVEDFLNDYFKK
ncbi:hypothetical protein [Methanobrevibacter boviskoreani]|uniref:hypothetical protein n=1 Tax=Methanobrevibacter boviskoreani TaxID=1348249 RepID=UPI0023A8242C|nr:hypothetical protein [Methanobrevibacter boviskoreani]MCI6774840.1 hypothetical protein [Methanobrevibacter boviskoreani]